VGGYKAYRTWALELFNQNFTFKMLGGYTGSSKTYVLQELAKLNQPVIDLEGIAIHKGSAFGGIGLQTQPSQEMFENKLALNLHQTAVRYPGVPIWIEDESQRIGRLNIPNAFWKTIRTQPVFFLDIPFEERIKHIVSEYGNLDYNQLISAVERIKKRFGPNETKMTLQFLQEGEVEQAFRILLNYYDKMYEKSLFNRENIALLLHKKTFDVINPEVIAQSIIST
jgi:tRNA 2-selenouridine synthase